MLKLLALGLIYLCRELTFVPEGMIEEECFPQVSSTHKSSSSSPGPLPLWMESQGLSQVLPAQPSGVPWVGCRAVRKHRSCHGLYWDVAGF